MAVFSFIDCDVLSICSPDVLGDEKTGKGRSFIESFVDSALRR